MVAAGRSYIQSFPKSQFVSDGLFVCVGTELHTRLSSRTVLSQEVPGGPGTEHTANILIVRTTIFYRVSFIIVISSYSVQWMAGYSQW